MRIYRKRNVNAMSLEIKIKKRSIKGVEFLLYFFFVWQTVLLFISFCCNRSLILLKEKIMFKFKGMLIFLFGF